MTSLPPDSPAWFCLRTQTKREHIAAEHLRELGKIKVFCPRLRYRKATRRGKIWWMEPLFPGYLLARFQLAEMERAVISSNGVRGLVRFGSEVPPIPDAFVETLRHEIHERNSGDGETIILHPDVQPGDEVEIGTGPLRGMQGVIVSVAPAAERVKILLEFLGQTQPVDLDLFSILLPRRPTP